MHRVPVVAVQYAALLHLTFIVRGIRALGFGIAIRATATAVFLVQIGTVAAAQSSGYGKLLSSQRTTPEDQYAHQYRLCERLENDVDRESYKTSNPDEETDCED